jgi:hypothetical protein
MSFAAYKVDSLRGIREKSDYTCLSVIETTAHIARLSPVKLSGGDGTTIRAHYYSVVTQIIFSVHAVHTACMLYCDTGVKG